ncbi:VWA domain-containing protein [Tepidiforma sp.]|uniref:VWA domain-containing protein n=1 Tax=Tepidiforma sp. TaxID=2682230 RepID=UPI002ADE0FE3|nr:VWA domain-containing protein [Tepidiforma sp.]
MSDLAFAHPWLLTLLPLPLFAFAAWAWGVLRGAARARAVSRDPAPPPPWLAAAFLALAAAAAILAAAQPRWGTRVSQVPRTGADLVIVMDISRSMDVSDVQPSRLAAAKEAATQAIERLAGDRVGLVVFAGSARVRFPLTTDTAAAARVISSLETGVVFVEGGTDVAAGLQFARELLTAENPGGRLVLLLTDGDNLGGDVASVASAYREDGIELLVAGTGTPEGGVVPAVDPFTGRVSPRLDASGQPILSRLDEPFLRSLAAAAGGRYLGTDLALVPSAVEGRLRTLERTRLDERSTTLPIERYPIFAALALALLLLAALAERYARFPRRAAGALALAAMLLGACATPAYEANERGREALARRDTAAAVDAFLEAQVLRPANPTLALNLAAAYHADGRYEDAIRSARRALESNDPAIRARAFISIGHHQFAAGRLPAALSAFRDALLLDPANDDARHDYEVILRLLVPPTPEPTPSPSPAPGTSEPSPSPGQGTPGSGGTPVPGQGTPGGDATPSPGQPRATGTPIPGQPTPQPGTDGTPQPGQPGPTIAGLNQQIQAIDREIQRLLLEAGEQPTPSQALQILELLAERSRIAALRDALTGRPGTDY